MTGSSTYDFGTSQSLSNSLVFTRMGADLNVGFGITYNRADAKHFGVVFQILPNLLAARVKPRRRQRAPADSWGRLSVCPATSEAGDLPGVFANVSSSASAETRKLPG